MSQNKSFFFLIEKNIQKKNKLQKNYRKIGREKSKLLNPAEWNLTHISTIIFKKILTKKKRIFVKKLRSLLNISILLARSARDLDGRRVLTRPSRPPRPIRKLPRLWPRCRARTRPKRPHLDAHSKNSPFLILNYKFSGSIFCANRAKSSASGPNELV